MNESSWKLNRELGLLSSLRETVTFDVLNKAIAKGLAATYWYGRSVSAGDGTALLQHNVTFVVPAPGVAISETQGDAAINVAVLQGQLELIFTPLALLLLSLYLTYMPTHARTAYDLRAALDGAGILQLTWLLGTEPRLGDVGRPEVAALPAAGMFDVQMSDKALGRVYTGSDEVASK